MSEPIPGRYIISGNPFLKSDLDSSIASFSYRVFLTKDTATDISLRANKVDNSPLGTDPCSPQAITSGTSFTYLPSDCSEPLIHGQLLNVPISILSIMPNPATDNATIELQSNVETETEVSILSSVGSSVFTKSQILHKGRNTILLRTSNISGGVYELLLRSLCGSSRSRLIISK